MKLVVYTIVIALLVNWGMIYFDYTLFERFVAITQIWFVTFALLLSELIQHTVNIRYLKAKQMKKEYG